MKRWERDLAKINWHQENPALEPILCPNDGTDMVGDASYGSPFLKCPMCDFRIRQVPDVIYQEYYQRVVMAE
jgi:hypothetical protein